MKTSTYKGAITYSNKINAKNKIQIGTVYSLYDCKTIIKVNLRMTGNTRFTLIDFNGNINYFTEFYKLETQFQ